MSNGELTLTLDRADATFHFGDTVSGAVEVRVASWVCPRLALELEWRTHGRGYQDSIQCEKLILFEGTRERAPASRYPFHLTAPNGPATYHGRNLNVDWYVRARADDLDTFHCSVEQEILLIPPEPLPTDGNGSSPGGNGQMQVNLGPAYRAPATQQIGEKFLPGVESSRQAAQLLWVAPFPLLSWLLLPPIEKSLNPGELIAGVIGILVFMNSLKHIYRDRMPNRVVMPALLGGMLGFLWLAILLILAHLAPLLADVVFGGGMSLVAFYLLYKSRRQRRLGQIFVDLQPIVISRGSGLRCRIEFNGLKPGIQPLACATLTSRETTLVNQTNGAFVPGPLIYKKTYPLAPDRSLSPTDTAILETIIPIPEDAPPTFSGWSNLLAWEVALQVSANGVPAWNASYPVTVYP